MYCVVDCIDMVWREEVVWNSEHDAYAEEKVVMEKVLSVPSNPVLTFFF